MHFSKDQIEKVSSCIKRGLGCKETVKELTTSQLEKNQISALYYRLKKKEAPATKVKEEAAARVKEEATKVKEAPATKVKEETADDRFIKGAEKDLQDVNNLLLKANRELEELTKLINEAEAKKEKLQFMINYYYNNTERVE